MNTPRHRATSKRRGATRDVVRDTDAPFHEAVRQKRAGREHENREALYDQEKARRPGDRGMGQADERPL